MAGADVSLTYHDCPDDQTDEGFEQGECPPLRNPEEDSELTPLQRVQKYAQSGDMYDRKWVPKVVQDIFRTAPADVLTKELPDIMKVLTKVADDTYFKIELLKSLPDIAAQALDNSQRVAVLNDVIGDYLIPLVVRNIGFPDAGVDKTAQTALMQMLERGLITKFQAEIKVCPSILALSKMAKPLDVNAGAVMLMSKLAPLLGRDITERILMKRFIELCSSHVFYVRKLAALNFVHYRLVVGKDVFEKNLLPCYLELCEDKIWGVRKACAEVMMFMSASCDLELRKTVLAPAFIKLLHDECRWVRLTSLQTLGAFITTFAEPPVVNVTYNASGDLTMTNLQGSEFQPNSIDGFSNPGTNSYGESSFLNIYEGLEKPPVTDLDEESFCNMASLFGWEPAAIEKTDNVPNETHTKLEEKHEDDLLSYNEYNYWYISPPEVELEDLLDCSGTSSDKNLSESLSEDIVTCHLEDMLAQVNFDEDSVSDAAPNQSIETNGDTKSDNLDNNSSDVNNVDSTTTVEEPKEPPQKIVPQELIDIFVSMAKKDSNDNNMSFFCAYSLPAVVLTLGKENWPLLKDTMDLLAAHLSYKIRRTIASSLHEIATIIGPELATEHLSPLFEGFLKDLDEVRIGILNSLFYFLELISAEKRATFLPKLGEFLRMDDACNWRFHEKLALQLTDCVQLFRPADIVKHIGLYAQALMIYNVAAVRQAAILLVTEIVRRIQKEDPVLTSHFLCAICVRFAHSKKWKPRQTFAILCTELLKHDAMDPEEFSRMMLSFVEQLSWDPVANVRLVVARCIVDQMMSKEYFVNPENDLLEFLNRILRRLQTDKDRDVRMSADIPLH